MTKFSDLLSSPSQIEHKGLIFGGFSGGHPGVTTRKFGEDQSKTLPEGLFFPTKFPDRGHNSMPK